MITSNNYWNSTICTEHGAKLLIWSRFCDGMMHCVMLSVVLLFVVSITYFSLFRVAFAFGNVLAVIMIMKSFNMFSITEAAARRL